MKVQLNTERKLYEIEVALSKCDEFNFVRNIVAFNVKGLGTSLNLQHECDMLVLSKSGYLTEIEIKRTWADFLADFKKEHKHDGRGLIKYLFYCVPEGLREKVYEKLEEQNVCYTGIVTYDEDLNIKRHGCRVKDEDGVYSYHFKEMHPYRKLFLEEQLQVARYAAMRVVGLKEKIINDFWVQNNIREQYENNKI